MWSGFTFCILRSIIRNILQNVVSVRLWHGNGSRMQEHQCRSVNAKRPSIGYTAYQQGRSQMQPTQGEEGMHPGWVTSLTQGRYMETNSQSARKEYANCTQRGSLNPQPFWCEVTALTTAPLRHPECKNLTELNTLTYSNWTSAAFFSFQLSSSICPACLLMATGQKEVVEERRHIPECRSKSPVGGVGCPAPLQPTLLTRIVCQHSLEDISPA